MSKHDTFPEVLQLKFTSKFDSGVKFNTYGNGYTEPYLESPNPPKETFNNLKFNLNHERGQNLIAFIRSHLGQRVWLDYKVMVGRRLEHKRALVIIAGSPTYQVIDINLCSVTIPQLVEVDDLE